MKIALGTDHAGYKLKEAVKAHLNAAGYEVVDFGTHNEDRVDYPDFVKPAARAVADGQADAAVVFGGSGNGEAIAANKVRGIRCAVVTSEYTGQVAKEHNDANVISFGERVTPEEVALKGLDAWLNATYEGGRHQARLDKLEE